MSKISICEEKLETVRNQLLDAWVLIQQNDVIFHKWERLTKGLLSIKNYHPDDRIGALDKVLAEAGLLHEKSGEQALAAPRGEERRSQEATGEGIVR